MPRPVQKPIGDLNEVERILFGLLPKAVQALRGQLSLQDREVQFFTYRYIERLPKSVIADKLYSYDRDLTRLRHRVLLSCKRQIFS